MKGIGLYILEGKMPKAVDDELTWGKWFEENVYNRIVDKTEFSDGSYVSTVFLAMDYSFGIGPPILFETMVFGDPMDGHEDQYRTWDGAAAGHERIVELIKSKINDGRTNDDSLLRQRGDGEQSES